MDPTYEWYTSISGIVIFTVFTMELVKKYLGNVPYFRATWTWAYTMLVSMLLTEFGHVFLGTISHAPGQNDSIILVKAAFLAFAAMGVKENFRNFYKPLSASSAAVQARTDGSAKCTPGEGD